MIFAKIRKIDDNHERMKHFIIHFRWIKTIVPNDYQFSDGHVALNSGA